MIRIDVGETTKMEVFATYQSENIKSFDEMKALVSESGKCDALNWFFVGKGGVHGSSEDLKDVKKNIEEEKRKKRRSVTPINVLVFQPRRVNVYYGEILVNEEQIKFIEKLLSSMRDVMKEEVSRHF